MSYGVKLKDISHEDLEYMQNYWYTGTGYGETPHTWYARTPDGNVYEIIDAHDDYSGLIVGTSVEFLYVCEADPNCRSCAGYCSRAIPSEEDYVSGKINRF